MERLFSLINVQWTKERNLNVDTVKSIITVQYNFKHINCQEFYNYLSGNKTLLKQIRSAMKYSWYAKKEEDGNGRACEHEPESCTTNSVC